MNFNSLIFLVFLAIVLILYWILPHKFRWILLLIASYYFYMSWNATLVFLIAGTTLVSYLAGIFMERSKTIAQKRLWLVLTLVVCIGALVFFKYFNFLFSSVVDLLNLFSLNIESVSFNILLPVGISFYTFQTLSYVIDVYRGDMKAEKHLGYYALFVSYFPQLVAGPIERSGDLLPQLRAEHKFNTDEFFEGLRIMLFGFFQKCVIADVCGIYVNNVFGSIQEANAVAILFGCLLFCAQMYCDFSGYSEIARGVGKMMGVKLTKNFDKPYLATSFTELFRRWHITLNTWFTEYLYIPLGGNRKGVFRKLLNTMIVFSLCGLWHGANWTYVLWGIYVGTIVCIENLCKKPFRNFVAKHNLNLENASVKLLRRALVLLLYVFSALLFRAQTVQDAGALLIKLFTDIGFSAEYFAASFEVLGITFVEVLFIALSIICMGFVCEFGDYKEDPTLLLTNKTKERTLYAQKVSVYFYLILIIAFSWIMLLGMGDVSAFVYFQF